MSMYQSPNFPEPFRNDRDRSMRAAEAYELQRAFAELDRQRREQRKLNRTLHKIERTERRHQFIRHLRPNRGRA
ncbi:hypothetical protein FOE78_03190 [Microlunatus elymi]|uniref:Uncharacterized protein n=1 Tax=Microlunatus elymi TaxID=2596828 RepID=A0A516PV72_9ACTN|nr:hypothetical protein [Microlunatus elymi]QDP95050.1 hypothetical protein FOE78_03190 [Microlunatus elymi]